MKKIFNSKKFRIGAVLCAVAAIAVTSFSIFAAATLNLTTSSNYPTGVGLEWNVEGGNSSDYMYKVFKQEGDGTWQPISSVDFSSDTEIVKVLNVYPDAEGIPRVTFNYATGGSSTLPKSASLKVWMEGGTMNEGGTITNFSAVGIDPASGRQLIKVTEVSSTDFNNNPSIIWNYDVMMVGTWDINGSPDNQPNNAAVAVIKNYLDAGFGVVTGHDTIGYTYEHGMNIIRDYFAIDSGCWNGPGTKTSNYDYDANWGYISTQATVIKEDVLTSYPWYLPVGTKLTIPQTHTCATASRGIVAMELTNGSEYGDDRKLSNYPGTGNPKFYISRNNNAVMIQTGHSNCQATDDERKVLANALFYLKQLTSETSSIDNNVKDTVKPANVSAENIDITEKTNVSTTVTRVDNGSIYNYYVQGVKRGTGEIITSSQKTAEYKSEVKGYSYVVDNNATTAVDDTIDTTSSTLNFALTDGPNTYLHIKAIDNAGNIGETTHILIHTNVPPTLTLEPDVTIWTNQDVAITATGEDSDGRVVSITKPDGTTENVDTLVYSVEQNGTYSFTATDNSGAQTTETIVIPNIDKVKPNGTATVTQPTATVRGATITIDATDDLSGVAKIVDPQNGEVLGDHMEYVVTKPGTYKFIIWDNAWNSREISVPVTIVSGGVTVKYVDYYNKENTIATDTTISGNVEDLYNTTPKTVDGWTLFVTPDNKDGELAIEPITVTYEYKKNTQVNVKHLDYYTHSNVADEETITGVQNDTYTAESKDIEGYAYTGSEGEVSGQMSAEPTTVTFYYKKLSKVTTKFIDSVTRQEISNSEENSYQQGDTYSTGRKSIAGYTYVSNSGNTTGTMGRENIEVVYEYIKNSSVEVKYVDIKTGDEIAVSEEIRGVQNDTYETTQKDISGYRFVEAEGETSGTIGAEPKEIIYKYIKQSKVYVEHVDESTGETLQIENPVAYDQDATYTTSSKSITGYALSTDSGNTTGTMGRTNIYVTYYYRLGSSVTANYIDYYTEQEISPSVTITGVEGDTYETTQKDVEGYAFTDVIGVPNGTMTRESGTIYYRYKKTAKLIVQHIDANTNEKIVDDVVTTYNEKDTYEARPQNLPGYEIVEEPAEKTGKMGREDITRTYKYKLVSGGLVVKYVDIKTDEILDQKVYNGNAEDVVDLEYKSIFNYFHVTELDPDYTQVTLTGEPQEVIYYYVRRSEVQFRGIDQDTGEILYTETLEPTGVEGDKYLANPRAVEGYTVVKYPENREGIYQRVNPIVVFEYKKNAGTVTVNHVDKDTQAVLLTETVSGDFGKEYRTQPKEFENYEYTNEVVGQANGVFSENEATVTYYYTKLSGRVVAIYKDEDANQLDIVQLDGKVGEPFTLEAKTFEGYELISQPESLTGEYTEGVQTYNFVYKKIEDTPVEENGTIIVKIVDKDGNEIGEQIVNTDLAGKTITITAPEIEGYRIVGPNTITATYINGELHYEFVYEPVSTKVYGTIIVNFIDRNHNTLRTSIETTGEEGTTYTLQRPEIDGYVMVGSPTITATYTNGTQVIDAVYEKIKVYGNITVEFVDENNTQIRPSQTSRDEVGKNFVFNAPNIDGYTLIDTQTIRDTYTEGTKTITIHYTKIPETVYGTITVKYVDENNEEIRPQETTRGEVGSPFSKTLPEIEGYRIVGSNPLVSEYVNGDIIVYATYEKIPETKYGNATIRYVDEEGQEIKASVTYRGVVGEGFDVIVPTIEGYEFKSTTHSRVTYTEEDIVVTITYKVKEIPIEPDPKDDPAPTPTPEPEPQPTPQPEEKTVDTSDMNVWMYLTIALGTTVVIVRETKKALNK